MSHPCLIKTKEYYHCIIKTKEYYCAEGAYTLRMGAHEGIEPGEPLSRKPRVFGPKTVRNQRNLQFKKFLGDNLDLRPSWHLEVPHKIFKPLEASFLIFIGDRHW